MEPNDAISLSRSLLLSANYVSTATSKLFIFVACARALSFIFFAFLCFLRTAASTASEMSFCRKYVVMTPARDRAIVRVRVRVRIRVMFRVRVKG